MGQQKKCAKAGLALLLWVGLVVSTAARAALPPVMRILPVGDSITMGYSSPAYVSGGYRTVLAGLLTNLNYNVAFTGLLNVNNPSGVTAWHEGHSGAEIAGVNYCMQGVFDSTDDPDVILLLLGTNDYNNGIGAGATNRLDGMISNLATNRPHAKIIVANVLLRTDNAAINAGITATFNPYIPGIVAAHATLGQQVYFTDMRSALGATDLCADGIHPNAVGYAKMATNWLTAITNVIGILGTTNAPALAHVISPGGLTNVVIIFSKPVASSATNLANFTLSGGATIAGATLDSATERVVTLATSPLAPNATYTLTVSNVQDQTAAQTPIAPGTSAVFSTCGARGATNNVAEAVHFQLVYSLNIPNAANYLQGIAYTVDHHLSLGAFGRVAYYWELQNTNNGPLQYMWVSLNPFTTNLAKIGVPTQPSGAIFQQKVTNMSIATSMPGIVTGTNINGGNLEFWPYNYSQANALSITNGNALVYDWGDQDSGTGNYGSMQIANPAASQMLFAFNAWGGFGGNADLGIGNNTVYQTGNYNTIDNFTDIQPDWTFRENAASYAVKLLQVYIQPVPVPGITNLMANFANPLVLPTTNLIALAGNPANYPLFVSAVSPSGTNGGAASLSGGTITYTPSIPGPDQFTYILNDGHGGTAKGVVLVQTSIPNTSTNLSYRLGGGSLTLFWPASYLGWILQEQVASSNGGLGTNWVDVTGSASATSVVTPVNLTNAAAYYRLRYPTP